MLLAQFDVDAFCGVGLHGNAHRVYVCDAMGCFESNDSAIDSWVLRSASNVWPKILVIVAFEPVDGVHRVRCFNGDSEIEFCGSGAASAARSLFYLLANRLPEVHVCGKSVTLGLLSRNVRVSQTRDGISVRVDFQMDEFHRLFVRDSTAYHSILRNDLVEMTQYRDYVIAELRFPGESPGATIAKLRGLKPRLQQLKKMGGPALIVTAELSHGCKYDYAMRYFAPQYGNPEDAATGSANALLMVYWSQKRYQSRLRGIQCSMEGGAFRGRTRREAKGNVSVTLCANTKMVPAGDPVDL